MRLPKCHPTINTCLAYRQEEAPVPEAAAGHEAGASWEERTGMHTWKKKEKSPPDSASVEGAAEEATAGK